MLEIETAVADTHRFSCFGYNYSKSFIDINVVKFNINVDYWTFMFGVIRLEIAVFMTNYVCLFVCLFHGDDHALRQYDSHSERFVMRCQICHDNDDTRATIIGIWSHILGNSLRESNYSWQFDGFILAALNWFVCRLFETSTLNREFWCE